MSPTVYILVLIIVFACLMKYIITPDPSVGEFCSINNKGYMIVKVQDNLVTVWDMYGSSTHVYPKFLFKLISWPCL